jgi:thiol-disulfide isomerase/thioredoxin
MLRAANTILILVVVLSAPLAAQQADPVAQALAQGDALQKRRSFDEALEAYRKADKLSHHASAPAYLSMALIERKLGSLDLALDDAKHALKAAGDNKLFAVQAYLFRATLLMQMSSKSSDKKLKEAEEDVRQALALKPDYALSRFSLGLVLLHQERDEEGVAELKSFVALPNAPAANVAEARKYIAAPVRAREPFAPDFAFTTLERENVTSAGLRGKVVLLDFWGTWCPPCRESVPMLRDLNKKYAGKAFQLVGISSDQDEDAWRSFIQKQRMDWLEYIDLSGSVQESFNVDSYPTYVVLDKDGIVRFRQSGLSNETGGDLESVINKALKRPPDPALVAAAATAPATSAAPAAAPGPSGGAPGVNAGSAPAAPPEGVDLWRVSGNVYENGELGMSFEFPKGWVTATAESIRDVNQRGQALAAQRSTSGVKVRVPKAIFYAAPRGTGDALRMALPSLRINVTEGGGGRLTLDYFDRMTQSMAQPGVKLVAAPSEFQVRNHHFMRADLEHSGSSHFYRAFILTQAVDYMVTIEVIAASQDELQRILSSLQSMSFREDQE